ncbi:MAG TPA: polymer-forming cytoskeletal protein [Longimicrobiales bacterium]|nr:polymer-forming cytoskeletal protein [Longimicrobiales bacterium]
MAIFGGRRTTPNGDGEMAKEKETNSQPRGDNVISIIGPGMRVVGDCETEGTLRIEGTVEGTVRAGKAVVIGKDGEVRGDVLTQDAIIGGRVTGAVVAESRLELQATCAVDGEIKARRIKLDEGGRINGTIVTGEFREGSSTAPPVPAASA